MAKDEEIPYYAELKERIDVSLIKKHIGSGAEGDVYKYNKNKAIKISTAGQRTFSSIKRAIELVRAINPSCLVKVHDFGYVELSKCNTIYWYIMDYLPVKIRLSNAVYNKVDSVLYGGYGNHPHATDEYVKDVKEALKRMRLSNNWVKLVKSFIALNLKARKLYKTSINYNDFHSDNVRAKKSGVIKLIDLEGINVHEW